MSYILHVATLSYATVQQEVTCSGSSPMLAASLLSLSRRAIMEVLISKNSPFQPMGIQRGCGR